MIEQRHIAPRVWTRLPIGVAVMQTGSPSSEAVATVSADGTVMLSLGVWHIRAM